MTARVPSLAAIGATLALLLVTACQTTVSRPVFEELSFAHLPPIRFDVARVEVVEDYRSPLTDPHVEHLFPTPIAAAVTRWANDRLKPEGNSGVVRVHIEDASAVLEPLDTNTDVEGLFTTEQAERVRARVQVSIEVVDERNLADGFAKAEAIRTRTIPEDVTLNERDEIYFQVTVALMNDFNTSQEQSIRQYLGRYLR